LRGWPETLITLGSTAGGGADGDATWQDVPDLDGLIAAGTRRMELGGTDVLFCLAEGNLYAYGAHCAACDADLVTADLDGRTLTCPACDQVYDIVQAGRASGRADLHLEPFPILARDGRTQVALPAPRVAAAAV
jgi:nitrite reductase/ring-hydroxylating ferredoxin subunit